MSLELPGFYFDEQRNRYFPLSSKLKNVTPVLVASTSPDAGTTTRHLKRKRQRTLWNTMELTRSTCFPQQRHQAAQFVSLSGSYLPEIWFLQPSALFALCIHITSCGGPDSSIRKDKGILCSYRILRRSVGVLTDAWRGRQQHSMDKVIASLETIVAGCTRLLQETQILTQLCKCGPQTLISTSQMFVGSHFDVEHLLILRRYPPSAYPVLYVCAYWCTSNSSSIIRIWYAERPV